MCSQCQDIGFYKLDVPLGHPSFGTVIRCDCKMREDAAKLQGHIGTPCKAWAMAEIMTSGRSGTAKMLEAAKSFVDNPYGWLTIWGGNGTGKSMTAQAIINAILDRNIVAVYITALDAANYLKDGIGDIDFDVESRLRVLSEIPVLCMDELAVKKWTDWVAEQFETLLDRRYHNGLGTVLVMDVSPQTFLSPRVTSRMSESVIVVNNDPDFRPALQKAKCND